MRWLHSPLMTSDFPGWVRFELRQALDRPSLVYLLAVTSLGLLITTGCWLVAAQGQDAANQALLRSKLTGSTTGAVAQAGQSVTLPAFASAALPRVIDHATVKADIALDEVNFKLDEGRANQFEKYQANLSIAAPYVNVRRFIEALGESAANVSIDELNCVREDIDDTDLSCDLVISAYFLKGAR